MVCDTLNSNQEYMNTPIHRPESSHLALQIPSKVYLDITDPIREDSDYTIVFPVHKLLIKNYTDTNFVYFQKSV